MPFTLFNGLIMVTSYRQVPLQGISVDVQVKGFVADVSATLKYYNEAEKAGDAIFFFPMDEDSAVYSFEATIEGKTIVADLQEKEQARKTYEEAISQGKEAFYLGEEKYSADIFTCSIGNLPPGQEAEVTLKYVQELPVEADGAVSFVLPVVLNPRYNPKDHDGRKTATRPRVPVGEVPYTLSLTAHFHSAYGIAKIESNCNITPLEYTDSDNTRAKWPIYTLQMWVRLGSSHRSSPDCPLSGVPVTSLVEISMSSCPRLQIHPRVSLAEGHKFDRDVELLAYYLDVNKPSVTVEAGLGATDAAQESGLAPSGSIMAESVAMFNFYSSLPARQEQSNCGEFIFLVDRSGSMDWLMNSKPKSPKRIQSAKETLVLLLKSLPLGCYFNIYGFGTRFESFFPESVEYTQQSMEEAVKKVNKMNAKLGGTIIIDPLEKIYQTAERAGHPRQLFVLTDGEVRNTKQVIYEVQKNAQNHRCFTFGIGEGASTSLIKGMARAGNGTYDFIIGRDRIQPKVLRALRYSLQPPVEDVSLTWTLPSGVEATVLSQVPTAIFAGQSSIVYAQLNGKVENEAEGEVCLRYKFNDEIIKNSLHFLLTVQNAERPTIHRLAAKALISELQHGPASESEEVKKKILETSLQSGVVSSLTAYVAVNDNTKTPVEGTPVTTDPPLLALRAYDLIDYPSVASPIKKQAKSGAAPRKLPGWFRRMASSATNLFRTSRETPEEETKAPPPPTEPAENPTLVRLISLQNADGSWDLTSDISAVLGISKANIKTGNPDQDMEVSVWVTVLAVIWLHTTCEDQREEWELLKGKAVSWVRAKAGSSLGEFVRSGNQLLKSSVAPEVFGL